MERKLHASLQKKNLFSCCVALYSFATVGVVTRAAHSNNKDGNNLVIFSGIALYYGDTYIQ